MSLNERIKIITQLFQTRLKYISAIIKIYNNHLKIIKNIFLGTDPKLYNETTNNVQWMLNMCEEIPNMLNVDMVNIDNILINTTKIYESFENIDVKIHSLLSVVDNSSYVKLSTYSTSPSSFLEIQRNVSSATNLFNKYNVMSAKDDIFIMDEILNIADVLNHLDDTYNFIVSHSDKINRFTIRAIGYIIDHVSPTIRRKLEIFVEQQKDNVVNAVRIDISYRKGIQGLIVRYGLVPETKSLSIENIFSTIGHKYNNQLGLRENLESVASVTGGVGVGVGAGILLLSISGRSPIDFDIKSLSDEKYIQENDLLINDMKGINKNTIEKYQTAILLPKGGEPEKIIKIDGSIPQWYVIETINGLTYRLLSYDGNILISSDKIYGLLNGLSTRCEKYNNIQGETILNECINNQITHIISSYDNDVSGNVPGSIGPLIENKLVESFDEIIKKVKIQDKKQFYTHVGDWCVILGILMKVLSHNNRLNYKNTLEYSITYIIRMNYIIDQFMKELDRQIRKHKINIRLFSESQDNINNELKSIYRSIIKATIIETTKTKLWVDYDMTLKEYYLDNRQTFL